MIIPLRRAAVLLALAFFHLASWAIGDSGGCSVPTEMNAVAQFGTPQQLAAQVQRRVDLRWNALDRRIREVFLSDPTGEERWRRDASSDLLNRGDCSSFFLLEYAVMGGNLATLQWLLDAGANPSGEAVGPYRRASDNLFTRCRFRPAWPRPDGKSREEGAQLTRRALQILVARGGRLNEVYEGTYRAENALTKCLSAEMLPLLLELGADRSPLLPEPNARKKDERYAPLQDAISNFLWDLSDWRRIELLAEDGHNDLRGTDAERRILEACGKPKLQYGCQRLLQVVVVRPAVAAAIGVSGALAPPPGEPAEPASFARAAAPTEALAPLNGRAALDEMLRRGILRRPDALVFTAWMEQALRLGFFERRIPSRLPAYWDGYLIPAYEKAFRYPEGVGGPAGPLFFDARSGSYDPRSDATVYFVGAPAEAGRCKGPRC